MSADTTFADAATAWLPVPSATTAPQTAKPTWSTEHREADLAVCNAVSSATLNPNSALNATALTLTNP
ncbi:MAG: hypothetical protein LBT53_01995 [Puniceicoccales bacterium]|nr:hypothetical protein [Puniceicoccales bacterium]